MAFTRWFCSQKDFSAEVSTVSIRGTTLTSANFDAQLALQATLLAEIAGICLGEAQASGHSYKTRVSNQPSANGASNREIKWLVTYEDTTTFQQGTYELPMADVETEALRLAGTDLADLTQADMIAFVDAFEAYALSPVGNAVEVVKIMLVGRNV